MARKKILFVAFPFSIHTARWMNLAEQVGWEIHFFPSMDFQPLHSQLSKRVIVHHPFYLSQSHNSNPVKGFVAKGMRAISRLGRQTQASRLENVIRRINPDIIHSLESQHAGYLVSDVKKVSTFRFPCWFHSTWGIDLHFFGTEPGHKERLSVMLKGIDVLLVEGLRDEALARNMGFEKKLYIFGSVGGGFRIPEQALKNPSQRRLILVKGTQDVIRRGLIARQGSGRAADALSEYEIVVYSANDVTRAAVRRMAENNGLNIRVLPEVSHEEMLTLNASARLNICVNLSDGVPNAMLEAMMMGAFPIQSETSMAEDWIINGQSGFIVPAEDPVALEHAIRLALTDNGLVDRAYLMNRTKIQNELNVDKITKEVTLMYNSVFKPATEKHD